MINQYLIFFKAWNNKGVVLSKIGKNDQGLVCFNKAISLDNIYADAYFNKAKVKNHNIII